MVVEYTGNEKSIEFFNTLAVLHSLKEGTEREFAENSLNVSISSMYPAICHQHSAFMT